MTGLYLTTRIPLSWFIPNLILKMLQQLFIHVVSTAWTVFTASMIMAASDPSTQPSCLQIHGGQAVCLAFVLVLLAKSLKTTPFSKRLTHIQ